MLYWARNFEGRPEHLTEVREFTRSVAAGRDGADFLEMVASELAGNAIQNSQSGEPRGKFTIQVADFQDRWSVRVIDEGGPIEPHICVTPIESFEDLDALGDEAEAGRGLAMVAAVSSAWGVLGDQNCRMVWAEILAWDGRGLKTEDSPMLRRHRDKPRTSMKLHVNYAAERTLGQMVDHLRSERLNAGLSQNALAVGLPVRGRAISEWETGLIEPTMEHLLQWSRELGWRLVIVGRDGEVRTGPARSRPGEAWEVFQRRRLAVPLRNRRLILGMSLGELGRRVGVSRDSIQRWELVCVPPRPIAQVV